MRRQGKGERGARDRVEKEGGDVAALVWSCSTLRADGKIFRRFASHLTVKLMPEKWPYKEYLHNGNQ